MTPVPPLPLCHHCNDTKTYEDVDVSSRTHRTYDPCPFCDPTSPRNAIPRLERHLALTLSLLGRVTAQVPLSHATREEIQDTLKTIKDETPTPPGSPPTSPENPP